MVKKNNRWKVQGMIAVSMNRISWWSCGWLAVQSVIVDRLMHILYLRPVVILLSFNVSELHVLTAFDFTLKSSDFYHIHSYYKYTVPFACSVIYNLIFLCPMIWYSCRGHLLKICIYACIAVTVSRVRWY